MTPEHKAKLLEGAARYRERKRAEAEYWARDYQKWQVREAEKMFANKEKFEAMQSRINELEQRLLETEAV